MAAYYPAAAMQANVEGSVVLKCQQRGVGVLERCVVGSEFPTGYGFGDAALRLAAAQRVDDACRPNAGAYREVERQINFRPPGRFGAPQRAPTQRPLLRPI